jgi:hypothetical protein
LLTPRLVVALIEIEIVIGVWLLTGLAPCAAWLAALVFFSLGAVANLYLALEGQRSCGCFGKLKMSPSITAGLDVLATGLLLACYPRHVPAVPQRGLFAASWASWRTSLASRVVGALVLMIGIAASAWVSLGRDMYINVSVEPASFDFGEALQGHRLVKTFRLKNEDKRPIKIVNVHSSCGCSSTDSLADTIVEPGKTLEFPVVLQTGSSDGVRLGRLTVFYQAVDSHTVGWRSLEVRARVVTDYWVRPTLVDFGTIDYDQAVTRLVRLRPNYLKDVDLLEIVCGHPAICAQRVAAPPGSNDICIEVSLSPWVLNSSGLVSSHVKLRTSSKRVPWTTVYVQAHCRAPVDTNPSAIVIGSDLYGPVNRQVLITTRFASRVTGIRTLSASIKTERHSSHDNLTHLITVTIAEPTDPDGIDPAIHVDLVREQVTDASRARTVTIPVHPLPHEWSRIP